MFKNHLKIAWRSLKKQPFFTFLNTFGLAIGMAGGLLISLYIYDELSYDKMFPDANRIHRINADIKFGGEITEAAEVSAPMAAAIKNDFQQVELTIRFRNNGSMLVKKSESNLTIKELNTSFVDDTFFDMFGLKLLYGDETTALKEPNTLILTKTAAERHFGALEPLGKTLTLDNTDTYTVTGILEDPPKNSFMRDHTVFMAMSGLEDASNNQWGSHNYATFIKLIPNAKIADFQAPLQSMFETYMIPWVQEFMPGITLENFLASGNYLNYSTIGLPDIHLYSSRTAEFSPNSDIQNVYILSFIALFLIVLASVNFMNLSTAHSMKRAKEVGIRKTLGSNKTGLIRQFLTESGMIAFISLLLAILLAAIAMPLFNDLSGKELSIPFTNPFFWVLLVSATLFLGLLSGSYPAFFMSRFVPVKVLKGGGQGSVGGSKIRNSLVVFQFAISVFLVISTLVVFQQLQYIQSKELGYTKDRILIVEDVNAAGDKKLSLKNEVRRLSMVQDVTLSSFFPTPSARSDSSFFEEGITDQEKAIQMQQWGVDYDYMSTLDLEIIAGRNFDKNRSADSLGTIINESALAVMGIEPEEALGKRLAYDFTKEEITYYTVIGVVKNFHFESLRENISALSLIIGDFSSSMAIKLNKGNFANSIAQVEETWNKVAPGQPFSYYFMDEAFNNTYQAEQRLGRIFIIFTILSILIACLGLFGLAAFNAQKRTKEIGIRKVLGASVGQITYRLTTDFLKMVGIAILIAIPIGWFAMNEWLQDFTYRIEISWWVFILAAFMAIGIAILTVSYQSIKAAIVNPVKSLRSE